MVTGCFNVLHPGHLRLLRFAKERGDRLIVCVESDRIAGSGSHLAQNLRLEGIQSISWIDESFIYDESTASLIERLKPNIVVKGKEHELSFNPELSVLNNYGGTLLFSSGETYFSSLELIKKEFLNQKIHSISAPKDFFLRHNILLNKTLNE